MKNYFYTNPAVTSAQRYGYGDPQRNVISAAGKLAEEIDQPVTVSYEDLSASGQVRVTGHVAVCYPTGQVHWI